MDWQQIQAFYSLVELGSMTRAAEAVYRTQSALSQQIARLESDMGCRLLNRIGKKGFVLTPAGEEFYRFAEQVLRQQKNMMRRIGEMQKNNIGSLTVSSTHVGLWLLQKKVMQYRALFPNVVIKLQERSPQGSVDLLKKGEVDFAIVHGDSSYPGLDPSRLVQGHYMLAVPREHPLLKKGTAELEDLATYPLNVSLANNRFAGRDLLDHTMQKNGMTYTIANESSNIFLNLRYTQLGFGLTFALFYDAEGIYDFSGLGLIDLGNIFPAETITLLSRRDNSDDGYKKAFADLLLEQGQGD